MDLDEDDLARWTVTVASGVVVERLCPFCQTPEQYKQTDEVRDESGRERARRQRRDIIHMIRTWLGDLPIPRSARLDALETAQKEEAERWLKRFNARRREDAAGNPKGGDDDG